MSALSASNAQPLVQAKWGDIKGTLPKNIATLLGHALKPGDKLAAARYFYGDPIVHRGSFRWPKSSNTTTLAVVQQAFKEAIPLCVVVRGSAEVFNLQEEPLQLIRPGQMFGVYEALDGYFDIPPTEVPYYSVSSGCRSLHVIGTLRLSNLADKVRENFHIRKTISWKSADPVHELVQKTMNPEEPWSADILVLPEKLVRRSLENRRFAEDLFKLGWHQTAHTRGLLVRDEDLLAKCNAKDGVLNYHLSQYLMNVRNGHLPCYRFTHQVKTDSGPFRKFQEGLYEVLNAARPRTKNADGSQKRTDVKAPLFPFLVQIDQLDEGDVGYYSLSRGFKTLRPSMRGYDSRTTDGPEASGQCLNLYNILHGRPGFEFLGYSCNGPKLKPNAITPSGYAHQPLEFVSIVQTVPERQDEKELLGTLQPAQLHVTTGFFNAFVRISRPSSR